MKRAHEWNLDLVQFLDDYRYQLSLTRKLDGLTAATAFDQGVVNEIVLWRLNRYSPLQPQALQALNSLVGIAYQAHRQAAETLLLLLQQPGIDLSMASALMRFRNPQAFQVIDRRAYRALSGHHFPLFATSGLQKKADLYFSYLDDLVAFSAARGIAFKDLDRILYVFDKEENGAI